MTTKRTPKWKRIGYQNEAEYRAACAAKRRTERAALAASSAKFAAGRILDLMWKRADFDKPKVIITKKQIMADTGYCLKTVKNALSELRAEGSIKAVHNIKGGSGKATTWRLQIPGKDVSPSDENIMAMEAARDREATWRFLRDKYGPVKAMEIMGDPEDEDDE